MFLSNPAMEELSPEARKTGNVLTDIGSHLVLYKYIYDIVMFWKKSMTLYLWVVSVPPVIGHGLLPLCSLLVSQLCLKMRTLNLASTLFMFCFHEQGANLSCFKVWPWRPFQKNVYGYLPNGKLFAQSVGHLSSSHHNKNK